MARYSSSAIILFSLLLIAHSKAQVTLSPFPLLTGKEGDNLGFSCDGEGQQVLQVNSNVTTPGRRLVVINESESSGIQYQLTSLTRSDNGTTLQCFSDGEPSNTITIIVDFPPLYSPSLLVYRVMEGSSPVIRLGLDAPVMLGTYTWRKNGVIISSSQRLSLSVDSMRFDTVSRDDIGSYSVTAVDSLGNGTATISLDVYYAPEFTFAPTTGSNVVNRTAVTGSSLILNCSSIANPPMSNISLVHDLANGGMANNVNTTTGHFIISSANTQNTGTYTCSVTNLVATTELTYNLIVGNLPNVTFTLSITFATRSVIIGGTYTDNSPHAVIRFHVYVNGRTYNVTSFPLVVDSTQFDVGQAYPVRVSAENIIGTISVANGTFSIQAPTSSSSTPSSSTSTPSPTSRPTGGAGSLTSCGVMALLMILISLYSLY